MLLHQGLTPLAMRRRRSAALETKRLPSVIQSHTGLALHVQFPPAAPGFHRHTRASARQSRLRRDEWTAKPFRLLVLGWEHAQSMSAEGQTQHAIPVLMRRRPNPLRSQ